MKNQRIKMFTKETESIALFAKDSELSFGIQVGI